MNLVLTRGREGVQNCKNLADVICTCPPRASKQQPTGVTAFVKFYSILPSSHKLQSYSESLLRTIHLGYPQNFWCFLPHPLSTFGDDLQHTQPPLLCLLLGYPLPLSVRTFYLYGPLETMRQMRLTNYQVRAPEVLGTHSAWSHEMLHCFHFGLIRVG